MDEPKYYGSWKGRVIEAIVKKGVMDWNALKENTELSPKSLNRAISELLQSETLTKEKDGKYKVSYNIYKEYKEFLDEQEIYSAEKMIVQSATTAKKEIVQILATSLPQEKQNDIKSWIEEWIRFNNLKITNNSKHFYLVGNDLDSISKGLIHSAKREILLVNPYVNCCNLSDALLSAKKNNIKITLVTRPIDKKEKYKEEQVEFHNDIKQSGISLTYNSKVHAKLIVVDREVAIVSSMNLTVTSSGGSSWEAGVVSTDENVVNSVANSIISLLS